MSHYPELPRLDCHAHIAPDANDQQLALLGDAVIFAMTGTLNEAFRAAQRKDARLLWGWGAHPGLHNSTEEYTADLMSKMIHFFPLIGEVGLDRRGSLVEQTKLFEKILLAAKDKPVLISVHSTGRTTAVIKLISQYPRQGIILHWFLGTQSEIETATNAGAYFSVNTAMPIEILERIPLERMLPETDFPSTRRSAGNKQPGDTAALEELIGKLHSRNALDVRRIFWLNLRELALKNHAIDRFPAPIANLLLALEA